MQRIAIVANAQIEQTAWTARSENRAGTRTNGSGGGSIRLDVKPLDFIDLPARCSGIVPDDGRADDRRAGLDGSCEPRPPKRGR